MLRTRRGIIFFLAIDALLVAAAISVFFLRSPVPPDEQLAGFNARAMTIESPAFGQNETIPKKYACDGENVSIPLVFRGVPSDAKSLALIVDDPDAPFGTWVHWTLWNVAADADGIAENAVPHGAVQGSTSFGKPGYGGPCPPAGTHRYFFKLYALDAPLSLPPSADAKALEGAMAGHILDKAGLVGRYSR